MNITWIFKSLSFSNAKQLIREHARHTEHETETIHITEL